MYRELPSDGTILPIPAKVWIIPVEQAEQYWFSAQLLDGYLFRLAWGRDDPGFGRYRLVARLNYTQLRRPYAVCGYVDFVDNVRREPAEEDVTDETEQTP